MYNNKKKYNKIRNKENKDVSLFLLNEEELIRANSNIGHGYYKDVHYGDSH